MKNSYKLLGLVLCMAFSGVLAMDDFTNAQKRELANIIVRTERILRQNPDALSSEAINELQEFCIVHGCQKNSRRIEQALGQGRNSMRRRELHAIAGQPPVYSSLFTSESSESSSSSSSESE